MDSALTLTDFSDRISPMVVKELRQGLRTRMFGLVMVVLHVLMVLFTLMSGGSGAGEVGSILDAIITLVLCIILPLRGFSAVADELKAGTLDMLALSRLTAGRIVFGKWASIAAQSLLIALSLLPYVVARYVFGGLDLFGEMAMLFYKWLAGVVLTALIIALSTQKQFWLRALVIGLPLLIGGCGMMSFFMVARMGGPGASGVFGAMGMLWSGVSKVAFIVGGLVAAAWLIFFFLSLAATRIAPAASQLAVIKRSVHLVMFGVLLLVALTTSVGGAAALAASALIGLVMMDALTEQVNEVPSVYAPFYSRGWLGRGAMWLLAPGWVTGFVFTLLLVALVAGTVAWTRSVDEAKLVVVSACSIWMIATLVHLFPSSRKQRDLLLPYICCWLGMNLVLSMLAGLVALPFAMKTTTAWFTCALPQLVPTGYATAQAGDKGTLLQYGLQAALLWPLLLLVAAVLAWRRSRGARQEAWRIVQQQAAEEGGAR